MKNTSLGSSEFIEPWIAACGPDLAFSGFNFIIGQFSPTVGKKANETHFVVPPKGHMLTIAPTRSGKGISQIIPNLLNYKGSCVVIDPKGENAWITAPYRKNVLGQNVFIIDPWDELTRRYKSKINGKAPHPATATFDPLSILNKSSINYADDLAYISDALIINQGKEPHWDDSARELVAGLIAYLVEAQPNAATLEGVRILLSKPISEIVGIAQAAQELGYGSLAARKLGRFAVDSREIAGIVSTAVTQTAFLDSSALCANMAHGKLAFESLTYPQGATVYLVLPVDKLQTYGRWLRLMVSIAIRSVSKHTHKLSLPVLFMLDEFGTIGRLSAVAQAYGLMAGLNMCVWAFIQDLSQLKRDYPADWETFMANSYGVTFSNIIDQTSAEYLSKMLGNNTIETKTTSKSVSENIGRTNSYGGGQSGGTAGVSEGKSYNTNHNVQLHSRPLLFADEIRKTKKSIGFFIWNDDPVKFEKITYHTNPHFKKLAFPNPYYPTQKDCTVVETAPAPKAAFALPSNSFLSLKAPERLTIEKMMLKLQEEKGFEFKQTRATFFITENNETHKIDLPCFLGFPQTEKQNKVIALWVEKIFRKLFPGQIEQNRIEIMQFLEKATKIKGSCASS